MPEAQARFEDDELYAEPRPRARQPRRKAAPAAESRFQPMGWARRRPGRTLAIGLFAGALIGIVANATLMQSARHPAPIFAGGSAAPATPSPPMAVAAPVPQPRPADLGVNQTGSLPAARGAAPANMAALVRATAQGRDAQDFAGAPKDQIASLLKGDAPREKPNRIAAVQRALLKVGFTVKQDGTMGLGTKQAIERFERDRGLQVTGDLSSRTLRELAAQSGVAIP